MPRPRLLPSLLPALLLGSTLWFAACAGGDGGPADAAGGPDASLGDVALTDGGGADAASGDAATLDGTAPDGSGDASPDLQGDVTEPPPGPLDEETAAALQIVLDEYLAFSGDPGVTFAVRTGDGRVWSGAAGMADWVAGTAMAPDMGFRVGSNTKPLLATVVLQLVEEGRLGLDDPLGDHLPGYPTWSAITIRQLLRMQSGIPDYLTQADLMLAFAADATRVFAPAELLAAVADDPLLFAPGEGCRYSNTNYIVLGLIVEGATGHPIAQEIDDRIVRPLGLTNTWLDVERAVHPTLAHGYMDLGIVAKLFGVPVELLALIPRETFVDATTIDVTYVFDPSISWAAGALVASAEDMVVFMRALLRGALLGPDMLAAMQDVTDCSILDSPARYGLGMIRHETGYGTAWGHGGLNFGYQASTYHLPERDLTWSHMHDYLPEQSWMLEYEAVKVLVDGPPGAAEACVPPEGMFATDDGPYLLLRFKGWVNAAGAAQPVPALAYARQVTGDAAVPLYGTWATATRKQQGLQTRVELSSLAPSVDSGADWRLALVSLAPALVARIGAAAPHELTQQDIASAIGLVASVDLDPQTGKASRMCFTAVPDLSRPSRVAACDTAGFRGDVGEPVKLFAALAVTDDPARVAQTLTAFGLAPCLCADAAGEWTACP